MMFSKTIFSKIFLISLALYCLSAGKLFAEEVHKIYEYKGKDGVPEFTDKAKADKPLKSVKEIKKTSPEEQAASRKRLEKLIERDRERDRQRNLERQLEAERAMRLETERELARERSRDYYEPESDRHDHDTELYWGYSGYYRPPVRPRPPIYRPPGHRPPIGKPPVHQPPGHRPPGSRPPGNRPRPPVLRPRPR